VLATHLQCGDDDVYTVDFAIADRDGGAPIDVPETGIAQVELVGQKWNFESVRSAAPYCCDLPAPYAWWATLAQK
jgi:hypothetical protein